MNYEEQLDHYVKRCNAALVLACDNTLQPGSKVSEAARYSLLSGGKRVRGVLTMATADLLEGNSGSANDFAAAIEMIHAYSLIHDDLPCMDDDDLRRGQPACHVAYGEANALLAGDLLLTGAFEVAASTIASEETRAKAVRLLSAAAGARGMIYGQELDLHSENTQADADTLLNIECHKTGALFTAAVHLGIVAAALDPLLHPQLTKYADNIGLCFQVVDDILDVASSSQELGKPIGSDEKSGKVTYVSLFGMTKAKDKVIELTDEAIAALRGGYKADTLFLIQFAQTLASRVK